MLLISAIIVSYNTRELTLRCLDTLYQEFSGLDFEILVVDNASADGTCPAIRQRFPDVKLIENNSNRGFGAANNQALADARGDYLLLINSDAFPKTGAIQNLLECMNRHPHAAVVGPRLLNADDSLQLSSFRFPSPARAWLENLWISTLFSADSPLGDYRRWPHDSEREVDWITGACMLVRKQAYDQVGGFDERFFMYAEETDWQRRLRDAGWNILFTPTAQVTHLAGASGATEPARINRHFFQSLDLYEIKHHGLFGLILLRLAMIVGCSLRALLWLVAFAILPSKRTFARSKIKLCSWLVWRQLTHWPLASDGPISGALPSRPTPERSPSGT